jgi:hypothetical protein
MARKQNLHERSQIQTTGPSKEQKPNSSSLAWPGLRLYWRNYKTDLPGPPVPFDELLKVEEWLVLVILGKGTLKPIRRGSTTRVCVLKLNVYLVCYCRACSEGLPGMGRCAVRLHRGKRVLMSFHLRGTPVAAGGQVIHTDCVHVLQFQ